MSKRAICVDFDGVIHKYSHGWQDGRIYDGPVDQAIFSLTKLFEKGYNVIIYTARASDDTKKAAIRQWLKEQMFPYADDVTITSRKLAAIAYIDDRGIRFTNWKDILNYF